MAEASAADAPQLKAGSVRFFDAVVIGLASTAPAYSLAAVIGSTALIAGVKVPAVLWVAFVPMFLIASAFFSLNKVDSDCGTTFAWVTRAIGPWPGWIAGWAVTLTGVLVVACAWFYRAHLRDSLRSLFFVGVGPIVGAIALLYLFVQSLIDLWDPENSYSGAWLGVGPPFVIGVGFMALGVIFMILWRFRGPERYWSRRGERVDPELARATLAGRRR